LSSVADIIKGISDEDSLNLFKAIAAEYDYTVDSSSKKKSSVINTSSLISKIKLTKKQFYSRMSALIATGLVRRYNGKYFITSLGKIVYDAQAIFDNAVKDYWRLKAIDTIEANLNSEIPEEERQKLIDILVNDEHLKSILASANFERDADEKDGQTSTKPKKGKRHIISSIDFSHS
jgi:hypothetical protein